MKKNKRKIIYIIVFLFFAFFVSFAYMRKGFLEAEKNDLSQIVKDITKYYQIRQIIATTILWIVGYFIVYPFVSKLQKAWSYLLAMPVGNAIWGVVSAVLLFLNVPYNRYTITFSLLLLILVLLYYFRKVYKQIKIINILQATAVVIAITLLASSGLYAQFYSSDSYYYIMQYGELIAKTGKLSSNIMGSFMTWTGIMPALISSFATLWGFETIVSVHCLLILSMYGCAGIFVYEKALKYFKTSIAVFLACFTIISIGAVPGVSELTIWVINNTYFMIYVLVIALLSLIGDTTGDNKILFIMSLFISWITLCRIETAVTVCFIIVCISSLEYTRKQIFYLYIPMCLLQILYFVHVAGQYLIGEKQAQDRLLTPQTAAVILLALAIVGIYIGIYNLKITCYIRKHLPVIGLAFLCLTCLAMGMVDSDRFKNNVTVVIKNLMDWPWKYFVFFIVIVEIMKICFRFRYLYFDIMTWGYILLNFAICMGRPQYLRLGIGDSYNRICFSIVPLYLVFTIYTFLSYFGRNQAVFCKKGDCDHEK